MKEEQRQLWKEQIYQTYPLIAQIPDALDMLFDMYEKDPDGFKKRTRDLEHKAKKDKTPIKELNIDPKVIIGAITKKETETKTETLGEIKNGLIY